MKKVSEVSVTWSLFCSSWRRGGCCFSLLSPDLLLWDPRTVAHQPLLFMGFPRQEYWSELLFPSPGNLSNPGIEPTSPALAGGFFTVEPRGKPSWRRPSNNI